MTRVLITGINYAPEETGIAPYTTGLAEHLATCGYRVTVLAGMPHYPAWRVDDDYRNKAAVHEEQHGVAIERRWHSVPRRQSALRRAWYEATFTASGLSALTLPKPDVVLGIVPSLGGGVLARTTATRFRVPYGLVFQDLMGLAAEESGVTGSAVVAAAVRSTEGWAARAASGIGVIAEGFRPYLEGLGVRPGRIRRVRNWTHTGEATVERAAMRAWLALPDDAIVCMHAGNIGYKQGLENVIEAARLAAISAPELLFVLMGDGSQRTAMQALASRYQLQNVRFLPLQPEAVFASALAAADVLLVNQKGTVREMSLPSKLTSYYAAGRPVVAAVAADSETAREITWSSGGIVTRPDDPAALVDAVMRVVRDPGLAAHLSSSGRQWATDVLSKGAALLGYEQLLAAVLAKAPSGRVHSPARTRARVGPQLSDAEPREERWAA